MPGLDGWDLAGCFQANPQLKAVPIVFLTAAITKGEVEAMGGRFWGYPFLAKPFVLTEVVACLKHHLADDAPRSKPGEAGARGDRRSLAPIAAKLNTKQR
jgi:DNA-binding response OmpR family regulator